jgi:hypothetical protein
MRLLTLPSPNSAPKDGLAAHVLLVGGNHNDRRTMREKLSSRSIGIGWQWENVTASHRDFPRCDAVIVFTKAVAHSLFYDVTTRAKNAKVPVIHHSAWPKTLEQLDQAGIGKPPIKETEVSDTTTTTTARRNAPVDMDAVIVDAEAAWKALPEPVQLAIRKAAREADAGPRFTVDAAAREFLHKYSGNPRAFIATTILATPTPDLHVTSAGIVRLYSEVVGKKADATIVGVTAKKVTEWLGSDYGVRRGEPFDIRTLHKRPAPEAPTTTPATPVEAPVPAPTPVLVVPVESVPARVEPPASQRVRTRFDQMLYAALDAGEKVTVQRVGPSYVLTYEDGVTVRIG